MSRDPTTADLTFSVGDDADTMLLAALLRGHADVAHMDTFHDEGDGPKPAAIYFYVWLTDEARVRHSA